MKNNNLPIHSLLKCLMLMTFGLFIVQGLSAKTFQKIYMFTYFEYDNTTGNNYVYSDDGTRWKVTSDGDVVVDEYNGKGVYISYGSELTLTSEKIFPASAKVTVNAGAAAQVYADITVGVDGNTKDMSYSDTYQQYYSNVNDITTRGYTFELNRNQPGDIQVGLNSNHPNTFLLIESVKVVYEADYGITITTLQGQQVAISDENRTNVLNEDIPSIQFDGKCDLYLNDADIAKITVEEVTGLDTELYLHLKGTNKIQNGEKAIINNGSNIKLTFQTNKSRAGSLQYICTAGNLTKAEDAFPGFTLTYRSGLTAILTKEETRDIVDVINVLDPIVNKDQKEVTLKGASGTGIGEDIEGKTTAELAAGYEVNDILYTLSGEKDGYIDDPDVVAADGKIVALNTYISDSQANNVARKLVWDEIAPGSTTYSSQFRGLTFKLPPGSGVIKIEARTNETGKLNVKFSDFSDITYSFDDAKTEFKVFEIPYAITETRYVLIYNTTRPSSSRPLGDRRAPGRKETTTLEIKGISIKSNTVDETPDTPFEGRTLTKEEVNAAFKDGHVIINDPNITNISGVAFDDLKDKEVTYVDLSGTSIITDIYRYANYVYNKVPTSTLIFVPAGCVNAYAKNVVIGSVCEDLLLYDDNRPFDTPKDFIAKNVEMARDFSAYKEKGCTVFLPYEMDEKSAASVGTFYQLSSASPETGLTVHSVKETKANLPYMFKPTADKVKLANVIIKAAAEPAAGRRAATETQLVGAYQSTEIVSDETTNYYTYDAIAGVFEKVTTATAVNAFNAYLKAPTTAPDTYSVIWREFVDGDANQDGLVNVTDIVATVNYIMEQPSADFNKEAADVNHDGFVNVTDIVQMVNIIMTLPM